MVWCLLEEKFARSRLDIVSGESLSVGESEPMMQSVELESPQSPVVSIEIISPDTSSPSSDILEVLTPPPPPSLTGVCLSSPSISPSSPPRHTDC